MFTINKDITVETVAEEDLEAGELEQFSTEVKNFLSEKRKQAYLTRMRTRGYFGQFDAEKNEQTQKLQKIEMQKVAASLLCFDAVREDRAGMRTLRLFTTLIDKLAKLSLQPR